MVGQGRRSCLLIIALIATALLAKCHHEGEHDKIAGMITGIGIAAEKKDVREIISRLSQKYRDPQGYDHEGIRGLLLLYFWKHAKISVLLTGLDIKVGNGSAAAHFQAILSGRSGADSGMLPEEFGAYRFHVQLIKESSEWKISSAKWERFMHTVPGPSEEAPDEESREAVSL